MPYPDEAQLEKLLDVARSDVFRNSNASFLGSILCSMEFKWVEDGSGPMLVGTDGKTLFWTKKDFTRCDKDERKFTLIHEIWHPARLHFIRGIGKDQRDWNRACDLRINNDMIRDGYKLPKNGYWIFDPSIDDNGILSEEEIYDKLRKKEISVPPGHEDMVHVPMDPATQNQFMAQQVSMVIRAVQAATAAGKPGLVPGGVRETLDKFLNPVVPWNDVLAQWMTDLTTADYSWLRRNRRFPGIYMPSMEVVSEGLEHLVFFIDVSGSITDPVVQRFNSEVKYIWEALKPSKMTIVQFDTKIHNVRVFKEGDQFVDIEVYGRGGTCMECVRKWIEDNKPTAAVIFSDMECAPMKRPTNDIPVLWAVTPGNGEIPDYGRVIHVRT